VQLGMSLGAKSRGNAARYSASLHNLRLATCWSEAGLQQAASGALWRRMDDAARL